MIPTAKSQCNQRNFKAKNNMNFDVLFRIVMCCLLYPSETYGFNLDIENAIVFDGPPESGYFGYSVALHSWQSKYW